MQAGIRERFGDNTGQIGSLLRCVAASIRRGDFNCETVKARGFGGESTLTIFDVMGHGTEPDRKLLEPGSVIDDIDKP